MFHRIGKYYLGLNNQCRQNSCAVNDALTIRPGMGREMPSVIFARSYVNGQPVPYAVDLAGLHAHGWDPLIPTVPGVYDGLQGESRCLP